jgi:hypothetical protein
MFNVQAFIYQLLAVFVKEYKSDYAMIKIDVEKILEGKKARMQDLAKYVIDGEIKPADLKEIMKDELDIVESEALALKVVSKSILQDSVNAIILKATELLSSLIPASKPAE